MGIGKPLKKSILHMNPNSPIWLGTGSESTVKLTAEVADGWFPLTFVTGMMEFYRPWLEEGFRRAGSGKSLDDFEIQPGVSVVLTDEVQDALDTMKPGIALYVGGMGHRDKNFHNDMMVRRGFFRSCRRDPGAVSRGPQARSDRGRARRLLRRTGAGRAAPANPRSLQGVGEFGRDRFDPLMSTDGRARADGRADRKPGPHRPGRKGRNS